MTTTTTSNDITTVTEKKFLCECGGEMIFNPFRVIGQALEGTKGNGLACDKCGKEI